jgi:hypothetical protein
MKFYLIVLENYFITVMSVLILYGKQSWERLIGKDSVENGCKLIEKLFWHLAVGSEQNFEKSGQTLPILNRTPTMYKYRELTVTQSA